MKFLNILTIAFMLLFSSLKAQKTTSELSAQSWQLVFSDEFNTKGKFDINKWTYSPRFHPAWAKYLTANPDYVFQDGNNLVLKMDNQVISGDSIPYHSGGIQTSKKFSFMYGKVEVRAKFKQGQGSWPAIWMMPEEPISYGTWPNSGEIDIMEHVNNEKIVHQTIHSGAATNSSGGSTATKTTPYNPDDYNIYGMIWSVNEIKFYVNKVLQYTYKKAANASIAQWPFNKPFYIILNQSGGAGWPGAIKNADLPFMMQVDWIKVYQEKSIKEK